MSRSFLRSLTAFLILLAAGCTLEPPFARTNPMDSGSDYQVTLSGPDSVHSLGELFTVTMTTEPALPADDYLFAWEAGPVYECPPSPPGPDLPCLFKTPVEVAELVTAELVTKGEFRVVDTRADYRMVHAIVNFGDVPYAHRVFVGQKAAALDLSCSPWSLPRSPCDDEPFVRDDTIKLHIRMFDALNNQIGMKPGVALQRGHVSPRDSSIVSLYAISDDPYKSVVELNALRAGATWVVVQIDDAVDSVRVAVAP